MPDGDEAVPQVDVEPLALLHDPGRAQALAVELKHEFEGVGIVVGEGLEIRGIGAKLALGQALLVCRRTPGLEQYRRAGEALSDRPGDALGQARVQVPVAQGHFDPALSLEGLGVGGRLLLLSSRDESSCEGRRVETELRAVCLLELLEAEVAFR